MNTDRRATRIKLLANQRNTGEALSLLRRAGQMVLVHRGVDRALVLRCPCGCNDNLVINLDPRAGPAWRHYLNNGLLTLFPSYWRDNACGSHFVLWRNRILWCGGDWEAWEEPVDASLLQAVRSRLTPTIFRGPLEIADELDALPWEVLMACRRLVRERYAVEGHDRDKGRFRAASAFGGTPFSHYA